MIGFFTLYKIIYIYVFLSCFSCRVLALSIIALDVVTVPNCRAIFGHSIRLLCLYDLEGDILYSLKWYKDDMEFFRFVPNEKPSTQEFPLPGINLNMSHSFGGNILITDISKATSGTYRCEISGDAPEFLTANAEKTITVHNKGAMLENLQLQHIILVSFSIAFNSFIFPRITHIKK